MERYLMISDAAKEVQVESHVLRYWEEELHLPIRRNELGHRYYTEGDVELFKQIKSMKEGGLQLKAIKMILRDGKLDVMLPEEEKTVTEEEMPIQIIGSHDTGLEYAAMKQPDVETRDEKARRLQWLLQQLIRETLQENNKELCREIKESVVKELDYQFRVQEEREEERNRIREQREEAHYQKLDAMLRKKVKKGRNALDVRGRELQPGEPRGKATRVVESQDKELQAAETYAKEPQIKEPQTKEPQTKELQAAETYDKESRAGVTITEEASNGELQDQIKERQDIQMQATELEVGKKSAGDNKKKLSLGKKRFGFF